MGGEATKALNGAVEGHFDDTFQPREIRSRSARLGERASEVGGHTALHNMDMPGQGGKETVCPSTSFQVRVSPHPETRSYTKFTCRSPKLSLLEGVGTHIMRFSAPV